MVKTLGQLRSENMRLKNEMEVREDFSKRNLERKKLEQENFKLRNPKKNVRKCLFHLYRLMGCLLVLGKL